MGLSKNDIVCPNCGNVISDPQSNICPRCLAVLIKPGCDGRCSKCILKTKCDDK